MKPILVHMSNDHQWTMQAVHLACALARNNQTRIILLRMIPVQHPSYLGTAFGDMPPTDQEQLDIDEYAATAEDYGVVLSLQDMQCISTLDALVDAAEQLDVEVVFTCIPKSRIPYWQQFQEWNLERRLNVARRQLFTLDPTTDGQTQVPFITIRPAPGAALKEEIKRQVS